MKKFFCLLLFFSILIISCTPTETTTEPTVSEVVADETEPTVTQQEALASPQAFTVESSTALPSEASAPLIDSPSLINIEMIDEANGWGVTEKEIVRTDDGGVTWYNVTPQDVSETGYSVFSEFLDAQTAWLQFADPNNYPIAGTLYKTNDGGITWQSFETPFSSGELQFVDKNNGWMLADLGAGAGSMAVSVFQTTDAGETWKRVFTNDQNLDGASDSLPLSGIKILLVPLDMQTAWVGGVVYASGNVYLFRTDDGGITWSSVTNITLPQGAEQKQIGVEKLQFISATQGVLVLRMSSDIQETIMYATNDGGTTWQEFSENIPESGLLEIPSSNEIVFYSSDQFYVTEDAGVTFNIINSDISFTDTVSDISFVNSKIGWLITDQQTLYRTEDGGMTWNVLIP